MKSIFCALLMIVPFIIYAQPDMDSVKYRLIRSYIEDQSSENTAVRLLIEDIKKDSVNPDAVIKELTVQIDDSHLKNILLTQQKDGSWDNINYRDKSRSNWSAATHAYNILLLAKGYNFPHSNYFKKQVVIDAIHLALQYWFNGNFVCENWWYNQIGVPQVLGPSFLLIEKQLSEEEKSKAILYMNNATISMTGQNRTWLAGNVLINAILKKDSHLFNEAVKAISDEISISDKEGIKEDYSFHQHGAQQQFGNYGLSYINSMTYWAKIFAGTKYAFNTNQISILRNYIIDGLSWIVWKGYMDISSCGRQLFKNAQQGKCLSFGKSLINMMQVDTGFARTYENTYREDVIAFQKSNQKRGLKYFRCSDMAVVRNSAWSATLKMSSSRVIGAEVVNYENMNAKHLADGALYIYKTAQEYKDIFPVWDWAKLPGVTSYENDITQTDKGWLTYQNKENFVGGISDGTNGISALQLHKDNIQAKKSCFFINNKIVCIGSGIKGDDNQNAPIVTTLNQCLYNGDVWYSTNKKTLKLDSTELHSNDISKIYHDHIGYYFLKKSEVVISTQNQKGSWRKVADMYDTASVEKKVFKLFMRHSDKTEKGSYAYMIRPAISINEFEKLEPENIRIISNTEQVHAIASDEEKRYMMVFYEPSSVQLEQKLFCKVSAPCIVMLYKKSSTQYILNIAEPTQMLDSVTIELSGQYNYPHAIYNNQTKSTIIKINTKEEKGRTLQLQLTRN